MYIFLKISAVSFLIKHVCVTIILKGAKSSSGTSLNFIFLKNISTQVSRASTD